MLCVFSIALDVSQAVQIKLKVKKSTTVFCLFCESETITKQLTGKGFVTKNSFKK